MSSPVEKLISTIRFNREISKHVFLQISENIISFIKENKILPKTKLPGTRTLSEILEIHRKTAVAVYAELESLDFIEIIPNKGAFTKEIPKNFNQKNLKEFNENFPTKASFSFKKSNILDNPFEFSDCEYSLNDGIPDSRLISPALLSGYYSANLKRRQNQRKIGQYNAEGSEYFKFQFKSYLNSTRGLNIETENLLITRSTEMTVFILSELLLSAEDTVVVGDLSYFAVNMIFQKSGAKILTIPVDQDGIDISALENLCKTTKIRMLYLTSHCHYPTTVSLSEERRKRLLQLSDYYGFIIIEDDYDYEFQYEKGGFLPLASQDFSGNVIYIGSFGKSLAPGFRTGFAVNSPEFILEMKKYLGIIDKQGDIVMEQALGEMIEEGEINRHLKKSLQIYKQRRDFFAENLITNFSDEIKFLKPNGGMAFWLEWKNPQNLSKIAENCKKSGLFIPKTILFQNKNLCAMRIGFANFNNEEIKEILGTIVKYVNT